MILLRDVPIYSQLCFLNANVRKMPDVRELCDMALPDVELYAGGFGTFHSFLLRLYGQAEYLDGNDDAEKYAGLIHGLSLLYTAFSFGALKGGSGEYSIELDKGTLLQNYRHGRITRRTQLLEKHGFDISWISATGDQSSQAKANTLRVGFPEDSDLIPAVKCFVSAIEAIDNGVDGDPKKPHNVFSFDSICNKHGVFLKGDFQTAFTGTGLRRDELNPREEDIVASAGKYGDAWLELVDILMDRHKLGCSGFFHYFSCPSWSISFADDGKRPFLIVTLGFERVFIELTLQLQTAEKVIRKRGQYSEKIRGRIESFRCVQCPKKCMGKNLRRVDGVSLCSGRAEARRIYSMISSAEDFDSVESITELTFG